jgi:hypothetical protein
VKRVQVVVPFSPDLAQAGLKFATGLGHVR